MEEQIKTLIKMQFNPNIAKVVGVDCAIMYANIEFWCFKNEMEKRKSSFHKNQYWTYNSANSWTKIFSFWSIDQIYRILKKLEINGFIIGGNFNKKKYDRTKWYSCKGLIHSEVSPNGFSDLPEPIPDIKPDNKQNTLQNSETEFLQRNNSPLKEKEKKCDTPPRVFDLKIEIEKLEANPRKDIWLLAQILKAKGLSEKTHQALSFFIRRNIKTAKDITDNFEKKHIEYVIHKLEILKVEKGFDWSINAIAKNITNANF